MGVLSYNTTHLGVRQSAQADLVGVARGFNRRVLPPQDHSPTKERACPPSPTPTLPNKRVCPPTTMSRGAVFPASRREGQAPAYCVPGAPSSLWPSITMPNTPTNNNLCAVCVLCALCDQQTTVPLASLRLGVANNNNLGALGVLVVQSPSPNSELLPRRQRIRCCN
jgi:hypothetical protein